MTFYKDKSIKQWAIEDRPREKLLVKGTASLTNAELIAILVSSGTRHLSALDVAHQVIEKFENLGNLSRACIKELTKINGIGKAKAISLIAAFELARRKETERDHPLVIQSANDIAKYMMPRIGDLPYEVLHALFLNRRNKVIGEKEISRGGLASTIMDVRVIMKEAILHTATGIVLIHNHPSGNPAPSEMDKKHTHNLTKAGGILSIRLLDHVIVSTSSFFSFSDHGLL